MSGRVTLFLLLISVFSACKNDSTNEKTSRKGKVLTQKNQKLVPQKHGFAGYWVKSGQADTLLKSQSLLELSCPEEFIFSEQADSFLYVKGEDTKYWYKFQHQNDSILEVDSFLGFANVRFIKNTNKSFSILDSSGNVLNEVEQVSENVVADSTLLANEAVLVKYFMEVVISGKYANEANSADTVVFKPNGQMQGLGFSTYMPLTGSKAPSSKYDLMLMNGKELIAYEKLGDVLVLYEVKAAKGKKSLLKRGNVLARLLFIPN